jgi:hypothetical protein
LSVKLSGSPLGTRIHEPKEHDIQAAYFNYIFLRGKTCEKYDLVYSIPNAGKRGRFARGRILAEGLRAGFPDVGIAYQGTHLGTRYPGMFIEFKRPRTGRMSPEQETYKRLLIKAGYLYLVLTDATEAMNITDAFLGEPGLLEWQHTP